MLPKQEPRSFEECLQESCPAIFGDCSFLTEGGLDQIAGVGNDDENFHVQFNVKKLIKLADNYPVEELSIDDLPEFSEGREEDGRQTEARTEAANLKYPIIVVANEHGKIFQILDGTHRVQKAVSLGLPTIKARVLPKNKVMAAFGESP